MKRISQKLLSTAVAVITAAISAYGQADANLSQYYAVPSYYNPGGIGLTDYLDIRGGGRLQWVGIDNAPQTFLGAANMPVKLGSKRIGVGLLLQEESYGLYNNMQLGAQVAYKLKMLKGELSIGLQAGFVDERFKGTEVFIPGDDEYHQPTDDAIPTQDIGGTSLDLALGAFYNHPRFWAGVSLTHANSPVITLNSESGSNTSEQNYEFQLGRVLYFMSGGNIPVKNTLFEVMPSMLFRTDFQFWTAEATLRARYNKFLSFGVGYRYKDAITATVAAELKGIYIGYSYDYPTSSIVKVTSGSHEIIAGYRMKLNLGEKNKNKHKSIRIM